MLLGKTVCRNRLTWINWYRSKLDGVGMMQGSLIPTSSLLKNYYSGLDRKVKKNKGLWIEWHILTDTRVQFFFLIQYDKRLKKYWKCPGVETTLSQPLMELGFLGWGETAAPDPATQPVLPVTGVFCSGVLGTSWASCLSSRQFPAYAAGSTTHVQKSSRTILKPVFLRRQESCCIPRGQTAPESVWGFSGTRECRSRLPLAQSRQRAGKSLLKDQFLPTTTGRSFVSRQCKSPRILTAEKSKSSSCSAFPNRQRREEMRGEEKRGAGSGSMQKAGAQGTFGSLLPPFVSRRLPTLPDKSQECSTLGAIQRAEL